MSWDDLQLHVLEEFASVATVDRDRRGLTVGFERYIDTRLEQRREAVRRYRENNRDEYRARDRERWQRRKQAMREKLPDERPGLVHHFTIYTMTENGLKEIKGYIRTGEYVDGGKKRLGEIYITVGKPGSSEAMYDMFAIAASMALQHGVPVRKFFNKFVNTRYEPSGRAKNGQNCTSILDYIARWVIGQYGEPEEPIATMEEEGAA